MKKLIALCMALAVTVCMCTTAMAGGIDDEGHLTYDASPRIHFQPSGEAFFIIDKGGQNTGPVLTVEDKYYIVQNREGYWCYPKCIGVEVYVTDTLLHSSQVKYYTGYTPEEIKKDFPEERYFISDVMPALVAGSNRYLVDPLPEQAWIYGQSPDFIVSGHIYRETTAEEREAAAKLIEKAHNITPGDINQDDKIDIKDALLALRISIGLEEMPNEKAMPLVDMDKDSQATVVDALYLLQISVGLRQA